MYSQMRGHKYRKRTHKRSIVNLSSRIAQSRLLHKKDTPRIPHQVSFRSSGTHRDTGWYLQSASKDDRRPLEFPFFARSEIRFACDVIILRMLNESAEDPKVKARQSQTLEYPAK